MSPSSIPVATLGTPRIGPRRELKTALESFWAGKSDEKSLLEIETPPLDKAKAPIAFSNRVTLLRCFLSLLS
jgi:hypothetical protein